MLRNVAMSNSPHNIEKIEIYTMKIVVIAVVKNTGAKKSDSYQYLLHRDSWAPSKIAILRCWARCFASRWSNRARRR